MEELTAHAASPQRAEFEMTGSSNVSADLSPLDPIAAAFGEVELLSREGASGESSLDGRSERRDGRLAHDNFPGYQLVREIRSGGQGVVYQAAEVASGRDVAIKVLHDRAAARPRELERFEREAAVLRDLNHPNIIAVAEIGVSGGEDAARGRPYLVMPYIAGWPLDEFVRRNGLSIRETLALFAKVCEAVNAAHLNGVIHRDLKPGNVRVDDAGEPHVLDFGLAKPAASPTGQTLTETGQFIGSLPWASPEQADPSLGRVDLRTDVYSLGAILFYLLTGAYPIDPNGSQREVLNRIVATPPPSPRSLRREIDGDVETIVLKCLSKERERRYTTSGELARDVRHYLAGEAIEAKRDSATYVLRKALWRHRVPLSIAAAFLLLLLVATVVSTAFWQRAERQADLALQERDKTEHFARFMEDMLEGVNPLASRGLDTTLLKNMLDTTAKRIRDGELKKTPAAELRLRLVMGRVYMEIAELEAAHEMLDPVEALARDIYPAQGAEMAKLLGDTANLHHCEGRFVDSLTRRRHQLNILKQIHAGDHEETARVQFIIVECLRGLGQYDEALAAARDGLEMCERLRLGNHPVSLAGMLQMAYSLENASRPDLALTEFEKLLPRVREYHKEDHVRVVWVLTGMGTCLMHAERLDDAVDKLRSAVELADRLYEGPHFQRIRPLWSLAEALRRRGRLGEAQDCARRVIDAHAANPSWDDVPRIGAEWAMARALYDENRPDEAIASLRRYVEFACTQSRPLTEFISQHMLAWMLLKCGPSHASEVEKTMRACLDKHAGILEQNARYAWMRNAAESMLGEALAMQARFADAEPLLLRSYEGLSADSRTPLRTKHDVDFTGDAMRRIVALYARWHEADPDKGYDAKAAHWRNRRADRTETD